MNKPSNPDIKLTIEPGLLRDNAYLIDNQELRHNFSESETLELKAEFFELAKLNSARKGIVETVKKCMANDSGMDTFMTLIKDFKNLHIGDVGTKLLKTKLDSLMKKINQGYELVEQDVFAFDYQEISRMAYYDYEGNYIYDRPLTESERQTKIKSLTNLTG